MIYLWLDDQRTPPSHADSGVVWTWVKTADEAIKILETGNVIFASLDHDLADEHYFKEQTTGVATDEYKEKTGYTVLAFMEENRILPPNGVRIHTMNIVAKQRMLNLVECLYGCLFQHQYLGTHSV